MTNATDGADFFRYQRLFGVTEVELILPPKDFDDLQMKVTLITDQTGRVRSASIQMRAVDGPVALGAHPSLWSKPFQLTPNIIGDDEFGDAA